MSTKPENPPAFPVADTDLDGGTIYQEGMSLRDYFAGVSLPTCMRIHTELADAASMAYEQADAMLKARES